MNLLLQTISFALAIVFILVGMVGIVLPILPGTLLIWLTVLFFYIAERALGYAAIDPFSLGAITAIALVAGTSELWLPLLGARRSGSSRRAMVAGLIGAVVGTFLLPIPLVGTIVGYALGVLMGEYQKHGQWDRAVRASAGGLAGWGVATALQLGAGLLILILFVWQVVAFHQGG
ncbi:MAG: DUF456 domain-containing protein [Anaerolineae bacterium]|nr:DUF456 domain-containing protein [Anaerolineae bacterium]